MAVTTLQQKQRQKQKHRNGEKSLENPKICSAVQQISLLMKPQTIIIFTPTKLPKDSRSPTGTQRLVCNLICNIYFPPLTTRSIPLHFKLINLVQRTDYETVHYTIYSAIQLHSSCTCSCLRVSERASNPL
jgi:hypothetical protein